MDSTVATGCLACGGRLPLSLNFYPDRYDRYDGKRARFCRGCRPAVKRIYMRLKRAGHPVTWSPEQVSLVRLEGDR